MSQLFLKLIISLPLCLLIVQSAFAVKIVRLELEYGSDTIIATGGFDIPKTNKTVDLELYDDTAPITVANYLDYVSSNAYDLTVINRSVPDFVLQTGGVTNTSDPFDEPIGLDTFGVVTASSPITNEPGLSNIRGTIAMAKISDQPDSATNEWFINLKDNRDPLDFDNGGFTVFGSIIDDGMETADQIAALPLLDISFLFGPLFLELPIADADPNADPNAGPVADFVQSNLVMILTAREINRPILRFSPAIANFGFATPGVVVGKTIDVVVRNTGNEALVVAVIAPVDIRAPFSIQSENCSGITLDSLSDPFSQTPVSSCNLTLQFQPVATAVFNDNVTISYTSQVSGESFSVKYPLLGEGTLGQPEITTVNELDLTSQVNGFSSTEEIVVRNNGDASLQVLNISGLTSTEFSQTNDCVGSGVLIPPGDTCIIRVSYISSELGSTITTLSIESNDPINNITDITLTGFGDNDADGILSTIEDAAPNTGDANFDGVVDSQQNTVASFTAQSGEYISLVVDDGDVVSSITVTPQEESDDLPDGVLYKYGILEYDVIVNSPGDIIEIGLVLPAGDAPNALYFFGETADNETPHWHPYPATRILPNVTLSSSTRNLIKITVQDGGPGDADQQVNGRIHIGPSIVSFVSNDDSSGFINIVFLAFYLVILIFTSRRYRFCVKDCSNYIRFLSRR